MFKKFYYYYLLIKKKSSCRHGVDVAQKVQKSGIINFDFNYIMMPISLKTIRPELVRIRSIGYDHPASLSLKRFEKIRFYPLI